jgi:exosortase/archaeosortase family protein
MRRKYEKIGLFLLVLIAFWPVWQWYGRNLPSVEGGWAGLVPLIPLGYYVVRRFSSNWDQELKLTIPICLTLGYVALFPFTPPLIRAILAMTAFCSFLSAGIGKKFDFNLWGLGMLTLPALPSLQFFGGYPLRVMAGGLAVFILRLNGLPVFLEGTLLQWGGKLIAIDAPCSGIQMLWAGSFFMLTLMLFLEAPFRRTLVMLLLVVPVIIFGNALRTVSLFYVEARLIPLPSWAHQAIGAGSFLVTGIGLVLLVFGYERKKLWKRKLFF